MSASFANTFSASFFLFSASLSAASLSSMANICTESNAALTAPSMATVATGIPEGICTVDKSASIPSNVDDFTEHLKKLPSFQLMQEKTDLAQS